MFIGIILGFAGIIYGSYFHSGDNFPDCRFTIGQKQPLKQSSEIEIPASGLNMDRAVSRCSEASFTHGFGICWVRVANAGYIFG
jgi:hypothetical protein